MNFTTEISPRLTSTPQPSGFAKYEFPSKKVVEIDWRKLASVDFHEINSGICTMELLQDHLNHIAFCQPETEIHIENAAGQRNILKMFRLAQLIIQYLFISQDYIENQLEQSKKEHQLMLEKYNEMKSKLKEQIEEAKKIKRSNKNLSDNMVYLNSLLSSIGALDHYKCSECPKAFRSKEFLLSHLQRKHPQSTSLVNVDSCFVKSTAEGNINFVRNQKLSTRFVDAQTHLKFPEEECRNEYHKCCEHINATKAPSSNANIYDQPSTSTVQSNNEIVYGYDNNNTRLKSFYSEKEEQEQVKTTKPNESTNVHNIPKSTDIDLYKVNEMQKSFIVMNDILLKLTKDIEEQKKLFKEEFDRRNKVSMKRNEEVWSQSNYEEMLKNLECKIEDLQTTQNKNLEEEKEKLKSLLAKQEKDIKQLTKNLKEEPKENVHHEKINQILKSEIKILKDEMKKIQENHNQSIERVKTDLKSQYETKLNEEIEKTVKSLNIKVQKNIKKSTKVKRVPKQIKVKEKKCTIQDKKTRRKRGNKTIHSHSDDDNDREKWYSEPKIDTQETYLENQDVYPKCDNESFSDSSRHMLQDKKTEMRYVNVKSSSNVENKEMITSDKNETSEDEGNTDKFPQVSPNSSTDLQNLILKNPNLWHQMKRVMDEELSRRLKQLDINEENGGITNRDLKSHLLYLIKLRRQQIGKFSNFISIRNTINKQVDKILDEKKEAINSKQIKKTDYPKELNSQTGFIKGIKNWRSKLKSSKMSIASVSDDDDDKNNTKLEIHSERSAEESDMKLQELSRSSSSTSYISDSDKSSKAKVDIHNETGYTIKKNLFSDPPLPVTPNYNNQKFFSNKTYGNISDEWDTEATESSSLNQNVNKKLHQSLDGDNFHSFHSEDIPSTSNNVYQYQDIKLKKPSGPMVKNLSRQIEEQLKNRTSKKLAGSVDLAVKQPNNTSDGINEIESLSD